LAILITGENKNVVLREFFNSSDKFSRTLYKQAIDYYVFWIPQQHNTDKRSKNPHFILNVVKQEKIQNLL
jgi:hypothetical protein